MDDIVSEIRLERGGIARGPLPIPRGVAQTLVARGGRS
jgi:hypothetical protein